LIRRKDFGRQSLGAVDPLRSPHGAAVNVTRNN
jgi:hypothetical protein